MRRYRQLNRQGIIAVFIFLIIGLYIGFRFYFGNISFLQNLYTPVSSVVAYLSRQVSRPYEYFQSKEKLLSENAELKKSLFLYTDLLQNYEELNEENKRLKRLLKVKAPSDFKKKVAYVIGKSPDIWHKEIIIDLGTNDGVKVDASVTSEWGLVGRVKSVTPDSAIVQLIIDNSNWVSCINNRSRNVGLLKSETNQAGKLSYLVNRSDYKVNDLLVTSGLGGVFPKGIPVGIVSRVTKKSGDDIPEVFVSYLTDFDLIEEVIVLTK